MLTTEKRRVREGEDAGMSNIPSPRVEESADFNWDINNSSNHETRSEAKKKKRKKKERKQKKRKREKRR